MGALKEMTRKEQIEHIWEYYRLHILGILFGLFIVIQILIAIFGPKPPKPIANVVVMGRYIHDDEKIATFQGEIQRSIDDHEQGRVEFNIFPVDWEQSSQMTMAMEQKLIIMLQAKEIDVLIVEKEKFDSYTEHIDLSPFEPLDIPQDLNSIIKENKDNLIKNSLNEEKQERVYGITANNSKKLKEIGLNDNYVISIPSVAQNKDNAMQIIKWLYE